MRFITPAHHSTWEPVNPVEAAHYRANIQEYARQTGQSVEQVLQFADEMNDAAHTSAELDNKIARERRELANARDRLELSNLKARLDSTDRDIAETSRSIKLSNGNRPDMSDPQYFPSSAGGQPFTGHGGTGTGGYVSPEEPRWQAERRAQQNQDAAQGRIVGKPWESVHDYRPGGVQRFDDVGSANHPLAPEHTPAHEFDNHTYSDGTSPAEAFVEQHGWKLHAGNGASK